MDNRRTAVNAFKHSFKLYDYYKIIFIN